MFFLFISAIINLKWIYNQKINYLTPKNNEKSEECTMKKNVLIVGVSGAGKSTLVNAIAGQTVAKVTKGDAVTQEITTYKNDSLVLT